MTLLLGITIKIAVLTTVALVATTLLHRRSAAVRHWVLATALLCALCLPAVELLTPRWSIPLPASWTQQSVSSSLRFVSEPGTGPTAAPTAADVRPGWLTDGITPAGLAASIWIAGAVVGGVVLVAGLGRLRRLAADSHPVLSGPWREGADDISRRYGVRRPVRILCCQHPTLLATWGAMNPVILLPAGAEAWAEDRVRAVLHHELAHVVRGDWGVASIASVLRVVYWFNPLLWIAARRLRHESERACDDFVLASGISGAEYATHLLDVARESALRRHPWSPAIAIAHRSMLERRVRAMLNARVNREPVTGFARATTAAVLAAATVSIGVVSLSGRTPVPAGDVALVPSGPSPVRFVEPDGPSPETRSAQAPGSAAPAQAAGGTIEGVLYDQFGGLLPGASVRLTAVGTGGSQNGLTDRGGAFVFRGLPAGDYELVTELPGFVPVKVVARSEPGASVRRHITLPIGSLQETVHVTCAAPDLATSRPTAPTASARPGSAPRQAAAAQRGAEPKIPATFTGGIGGQIKVPVKISNANPVCPTGVTPRSTVIRLAGRIGIDGLFTDLRDLSTDVQPEYVASAMEATRQWVFTPTLLNGAPIDVNINVTVSYSWSN